MEPSPNAPPIFLTPRRFPAIDHQFFLIFRRLSPFFAKKPPYLGHFLTLGEMV
jgi:hypothetical protein